MRDFATLLHADQLDALQKGVLRYRYRDVLCRKNPFDLAIYMRLLWDVRPATIIEIGSSLGGSALLLRDIARMAEIDCPVVSIDPTPPPASFDGISFLQGDLHSLRQTLRRHKLQASPRPWLVIVSSARTFAACTTVLEFFGNALKAGDHLIVENGALADPSQEEEHKGGPNAAISTYLEARPSAFEVVTAYCDMFGHNATCNPNGYLRKLPANPAAAAKRREAEELVRGSVPYLDALATIHRLLSPAFYLEIGVNRGRSLQLAKGRAVGVDPAYKLDIQLPPSTTFVNATSDDFFDSAKELLAGDAPDLVFIDGMHLFENALRDFINAERVAARHGLIVIDDVIPNHPAQAARQRRTMRWTGDVWKLRAILGRYRPDLRMLALDTSPVGMLMVAGLDAANRVLSAEYASIVRAYRRITEPPPTAFSREGAVSPDGPEVKQLIARLRSLRARKKSLKRLVRPRKTRARIERSLR
jgi:cephalosporin hydroxylase